MATKPAPKFKVVADNRKARFNYEIGETFEAGIAKSALLYYFAMFWLRRRGTQRCWRESSAARLICKWGLNGES